ncbi:MAG: thioredoxin domain-containing protein [Leptospiraceae bacterium]|nr:thioredoxin domain-containing protein [Leptospiraceae bacterium]
MAAKKPLPLYIIISGFAAALIAFVLAGLLACKHSGVCTSTMGCDILTGADGCQDLKDSRYGQLLGIPIAWFGVAYYAVLTAVFGQLYLMRERASRGAMISLAVFLAVFGFIFDMYLAVINFAYLVNPCLLCALTYICQAAIVLAAGALYFREAKEDKSVSEMRTFGTGFLKAWPAYLGAVALLLITVAAIALQAPGMPEDNDGVACQGPGCYRLPAESQIPALLRDFEKLQQVNVDTGGLQSVEGAADAYIIIHEWADFRCPHCLHATELLQQAQERWPGRLRVYYRYFPLDGNCNAAIQRKGNGWSCNAARASVCASAQPDFFPAYYHAIFGLQNRNVPPEWDELERLARMNGGNWDRIAQCLQTGAHMQAIKRDVNDGLKLEISATPTLVLQNRLLPSGTPEKRGFLAILDALVIQREGPAAIQEFETRFPPRGAAQ